MSDDPQRFELLEGMDAPRPLPADLRHRLEQQLLGAAEPRPLSTEQRAALVSVLPRRRRAPLWIGAGVAAAAVGVLVLVVPQHHPVPTSSALPVPTASTVPPVVVGAPLPGTGSGSGSLGAASTGGGTTGGGTTGGVAAGGVAAGPRSQPTPTAAAPQPASAGGPFAGSTSEPFTVTAISPTSGPVVGGTRVRITGTGLALARSVLFGTKPGTRLVHESDGAITVLTPAVTTPQAVTVAVRDSTGTTADGKRTFRYRVV